MLIWWGLHKGQESSNEHRHDMIVLKYRSQHIYIKKIVHIWHFFLVNKLLNKFSLILCIWQFYYKNDTQMFNNLSLLTYEIPYIWIYNMYWYIKSQQLDLKWLYPLMVHCWVERLGGSPALFTSPDHILWDKHHLGVICEDFIRTCRAHPGYGHHGCEVWCAVTLAKGSSSDFAKSKLA